MPSVEWLLNKGVIKLGYQLGSAKLQVKKCLTTVT